MDTDQNNNPNAKPQQCKVGGWDVFCVPGTEYVFGDGAALWGPLLPEDVPGALWPHIVGADTAVPA